MNLIYLNTYSDRNAITWLVGTSQSAEFMILTNLDSLLIFSICQLLPVKENGTYMVFWRYREYVPWDTSQGHM